MIAAEAQGMLRTARISLVCKLVGVMIGVVTRLTSWMHTAARWRWCQFRVRTKTRARRVAALPAASCDSCNTLLAMASRVSLDTNTGRAEGAPTCGASGRTVGDGRGVVGGRWGGGRGGVPG
jgi:hypothetical protein